jgi:hypothetical protein
MPGYHKPFPEPFAPGGPYIILSQYFQQAGPGLARGGCYWENRQAEKGHKQLFGTHGEIIKGRRISVDRQQPEIKRKKIDHLQEFYIIVLIL